MRYAAASLLIALALSPLACGDTGRERVEIALAVQGSAAREVDVEGGTLRLQEAQVMIGPLYLCATASAESALCEIALGEQLAPLAVDALDPGVVESGQLAATTGEVRSAFFDYGISWLLTKPAPAPLPDAPLSHSAVLRFTARAEDGSELEVEAVIDVSPVARGDAAVNGRKTEQRITQRPHTLTLRFDPNQWLTRVDLTELTALDEDGDGHVSLPADSQPYEAILQGMTARFPPAFIWD